MDIKVFLDRPEIKELIANGNLDAVYDEYSQYSKSGNHLSAYLLNKGINPVNYFTDSIPYNAFHKCFGLTEIDIPANITFIDANAFYLCISLANVTFGENSRLATISNFAFGGCTSLTSIDIPDSVTEISFNAFYECANLATVKFGENSQLIKIGPDAFENCKSLTSITLPRSIKKIATYAFFGCNSLKDIYYRGTKRQWEKVTKGAHWWTNNNPDITIHCSDGDIALTFYA